MSKIINKFKFPDDNNEYQINAEQLNGKTADVIKEEATQYIESTVLPHYSQSDHTHDDYLTSHQTIKQDGVTGATINRFGTCSTGASTAAKTVSISNGTFSLEAGARVAVKFSNANTASNPTLNVNSKGAKNIFHKGARITTGGNKALLAGIVDFIYDGTQWHLVGNYIDTTGADGDTKVTQAYSTINNVYPLLMTATAGNSSTSSRGATTAILNNKFYANPSTGELVASGSITTDRIFTTFGVNVSDSYTVFFGDYDSMPDDVAFSSCEGYPVIQSQPATPGIIMKESSEGTETLYKFPANNGSNTVVSTIGPEGQYIRVVDSLPASPDSNTLYFIK